jgi:L-threonylcarbamoyladenylate synthase
MAKIGLDVAYAKELLRRGDLVAIPTETVYGLAGNALSTKSVAKIFAVKNRPSFDPLIVHTCSIERVEALVAEFPEPARQLAAAFWPGSLTLLLPKHPEVPDLVTSGMPRVGVRIPHHPLTLSLLEALEFPLAAPSANPFGYVSPTTAQHVQDQLGGQIPYILDGGSCQVGLESTIVGFDQGVPVIYRMGGISRERIEQVVGPVEAKIHSSSNPLAPGQLISHYSPGKPVILGDIEALLETWGSEESGVLSFQKMYLGVAHTQVLSTTGDMEEAARNLFAALRWFAHQPVKRILAAELPEVGLGRAINDRLRRAAAKG